MCRKRIAATLIFGAVAMAPPATAQGLHCLPRDILTEKLSNRYDERLTGGGLQNAQQLLEVWSSAKSGSFTVFITTPDGRSCVVATGRNWNLVSEPDQKDLAG